MILIAHSIVCANGSNDTSMTISLVNSVIEEQKVWLPSLPNRSFRVKLEFLPSNKGGLIWVEDKKSKEQWNVIVRSFADFSTCGHVGMPDQTIFEFLQVKSYFLKKNCYHFKPVILTCTLVTVCIDR